jgi:hypothetical protein
MPVRAATPWVDTRALAANTAETVTVHTFTGAGTTRVVVIFKADSGCPDYYVRVGGTATVPSADVTDGTGSEGNPAALNFAGGGTFSIIAPTACKLTLPQYPGLL